MFLRPTKYLLTAKLILYRQINKKVARKVRQLRPEAVMAGLIYARKKPVLTRKLSSRRAVEQWAKETYQGVRLGWSGNRDSCFRQRRRQD